MKTLPVIALFALAVALAASASGAAAQAAPQAVSATPQAADDPAGNPGMSVFNLQQGLRGTSDQAEPAGDAQADPDTRGGTCQGEQRPPG
jgi:hypothetical protein